MRRIGPLTLAVAALALGAPPVHAEPLRFHPPQVIDETFPGGEPVVFVDTVHHTIVYSSHEGTTHIYRPGLPASHTFSYGTEYRNQVKIWTSPDGGRTFHRVDYNGTGFTTDPSKNVGFSDPDLTQDEGGRLYNTGIDLVNQTLFSSPDGGRTWDTGTVQCRPGDRPWLAGAKKDEVFFATNTLVERPSHRVFTSTDAGRTCSVGSIPAGGSNWTGEGKLYYDRVTDQLIEPARNSSGTTLGLSVWKRGDDAFEFRPGPTNTSLYAHWSAIAIDGKGTTYLVWDTDAREEGTNGGCGGDDTPAANEILMAYTKDWGKTWSDTITIARPEGKRVLWPWIAAGDDGKVSVVWYQTDKVVDLACEKAAISVYAANIVNANDDARREIHVADAAGRPISVNDICQSGTTCVATGEDRRLGDFFTNAIDENGCVIIGTGDTTVRDIATSGERAVSAPLFIQQKSGPRLIGEGDCSGVNPARPSAPGPPLPGQPAVTRACRSHRKFNVHLRAPRGQRLASAKVYVNGRRTRVFRRHGSRRLHAVVDLRGLRKGRFTVKIVGITSQGRRVVSTRKYRTCAPKRRS